MRPVSLITPLILIAAGSLFLINNLRPDLPLMELVAQSWPWVLIAWGFLRLVEIGVWAVRRKPLPSAGISGGEWALILFLTLAGSGLFFATQRAHWPMVHMRRGIEMFGQLFDRPLDPLLSDARGVERVLIENPYGNTRVLAGEEQSVSVTGSKWMRAFVREQAEEALDRIGVEAVREGSTLIVRQTSTGRTGDRSHVSLDLEVVVPKGVRIDARGRRGDFDISGITGDVDIESANAGVRLENLGGNVRISLRASDIVRAVGVKGNLDLKGSGHDVEVERVQGTVTVDGTWIGDLRFSEIPNPVRFAGALRSRGTEWRVESCPGQIQMTRDDMLFRDVKGPISIEARSRDVRVTDFSGPLELKVERGDLHVSPVSLPLAPLVVSTDSGEVDLVLPGEAKFRLKATVDKGEVENRFGSDLQVSEEGRGGSVTGGTGEGPDLNLRAGRGSIRIRKIGDSEPEPPPMPPRPPAPPRRFE